MKHTLHIAPIQLEEIDAVIALLDARARWLAKRGIAQWQSPLPERFVDLLRLHAAGGHVFLARLADDSAVGTFRFEWREPDLWPDDPEGEAGYLFSLATHPDYAGQSLGAALLNWAADYLRIQGYRYLRLDCIADNTALRAYYPGQGFVALSVVEHEGVRYARFERRLYSRSQESGARMQKM
ncbi:GNAT family N-acetyltransferase [Candidatus Gracilibacteria bacterium]|nr:GNAT family N-acetyltransferase [Candidatus Gracilibacteria bacterium]